MKFSAFFNLIILSGLFLQSQGAMASWQVSCFKQAMSDKDVLPATKILYNRKTDAVSLEEQVIRLCSKATGANDPLSCFKESISDNDVLPAVKYVNQGKIRATILEDYVVDLCSGNPSPK